MPACLTVLGCTTLAGLDKDYTVTPEGDPGGAGGNVAGSGGTPSGGIGGQGATGAGGTGGQGAAGAGGSGGAAGAGGSGGAAGSGGSPGSEDCGNGADDDGDGQIDCFDADCDTASSCAGRCAAAATLECDTVRTGQSSNAPGSTNRIAPPDYNCSSGARAGQEYAYRFAAPSGTQVFASIYGLAGDLGLFMVEVSTGAQCDAVQSCRAFGDLSTGAEPEAMTFSPESGRDYFLIVDGPAPSPYSISVQCSGRSTCRPVRAIQAGQSITGRNDAGSAPNVTDDQDIYTCAGGLHAAPEAAFVFTPTETGTYDITLTGLTGNLNLFIMAAPHCDATCMSATSVSTNTNTQSERIMLAAEADTSYYIVADGFVISPFTLSVTRL